MRCWSSLALTLLILASPAGGQDFRGLKLGMPVDTTASLGAPLARDVKGFYVIGRWRLPGGHDLSVTGYQNGPIVYMESFRNPAAPVVVDEGLRFGATTRDQLLSMLGNAGFNYATRPPSMTYQGADVFFHSYELLNEPGTVVTFAFARPFAERGVLPDGAAVLDSIVVARADYLSEIWGRFLPPRSGYAKITLQY